MDQKQDLQDRIKLEAGDRVFDVLKAHCRNADWNVIDQLFRKCLDVATRKYALLERRLPGTLAPAARRKKSAYLRLQASPLPKKTASSAFPSAFMMTAF